MGTPLNLLPTLPVLPLLHTLHLPHTVPHIPPLPHTLLTPILAPTLTRAGTGFFHTLRFWFME